jgi:hypothetical protein
VTTKTAAAHDVRKVLQAVKDFYSHPSHVRLTEADTRAHFIDPLVRALGYQEIGDVQHELYVQDAKQFLDYLLFVEKKPRVAVEAKALDIAISDANGGAQVVQYAVILGVEWGVVTNGRQWRLYQTAAKGPLADKLILSVDLIGWETDGQFETVFDQLWLVSKESLDSGAGPETWLSAKRLNETLRATLVDAASPEIKLLKKRLLDRGIAASTGELAMWFKAHLESSIALAQKAPPPGLIPAVTTHLATTNAVNEAPAPSGESPRVRVADGPLYLMTPVKDEPDAPVEETLHSLLDQGLYVFGDRTAGRAVLREGDRICFYHSGVGVVAHAEIASGATKRSVKFVKDGERYPWAFEVRDVRYYLDSPVVVDVGLRAQLDAFEKNNPAGNWSFFVQGTRYLTAHDFALLTRN